MRFRLVASSIAPIVLVAAFASVRAVSAQMAGMATPAAPVSQADMIKSAMAAAPAAVSGQATIMAVDAQMQPHVLREGTNGWTCIPDNPVSPGPDPMCVDKNGLEWMKAYMAHQDPPKDLVGFGYMLMGGSDASNDDPFASAPASGHEWVDTGAHVMIFNPGDRLAGYPTTAANPKAPYVMWANTPYAHLMIPVK